MRTVPTLLWLAVVIAVFWMAELRQPHVWCDVPHLWQCIVQTALPKGGLK